MARERPLFELLDELADLMGQPRVHRAQPAPFEAPGVARRRAAIQALIDRGATEGERAAARAAMQRLDADLERDELERVRPDLLEQEEDEDDFIPL